MDIFCRVRTIRRLLLALVIATLMPLPTLADDKAKFQELTKLNQQIPVLFASGKTEQAIKMSEKAFALADDLESKARQIAPSMPDAVLVNCAVPYISLGSISAQKGNYLDAIKYNERAIEIGKKMGPFGVLVKGPATAALAQNYFEVGNIESAEKYINTAMALLKNDTGPNIPGFDKSALHIPVLCTAAQVAIAKSSNADARKYLNEAKDVFEKAIGKSKGGDNGLNSTFGPMQKLVALQLNLIQGELAVAEQRFVEAKEIFEKCRSETTGMQIQHPGLKQRIIFGLAIIYSDLAEHKNAVKASREAKEIWGGVTPRKTSQYAFLLARHALILARAGETEEAKNSFDELQELKINTAELGFLEPVFFDLMQVVAQKFDEHEKSVVFGERAVKACKSFGPDYSYTANARVNLAKSYLNSGQNDQAADSLTKALKIISSLELSEQRVLFEAMVPLDRLFNLQNSAFRKWTTKNGKFSRTARFAAIDSGHLVLIDQNEKKIRVSLEKIKRLSDSDKDFLLLVICKSPVVFPNQARALIEAGANINAKDENGWTPLMNASIMSCEPWICDFLRNKGADETLEDKNGLSAKMLTDLNLYKGEYVSTKELTKGQMFLLFKEYDMAIESLSKAINSSPHRMSLTLAKAYHYRAKAYENKGESEKAAADKQQAINLGF